MSRGIFSTVTPRRPGEICTIMTESVLSSPSLRPTCSHSCCRRVSPALLSEPYTRMFSALLNLAGRLPRSAAATGTRLMLVHTDRYFAYATITLAASTTTATTETQPMILVRRDRRARPATGRAVRAGRAPAWPGGRHGGRPAQQAGSRLPRWHRPDRTFVHGSRSGHRRALSDDHPEAPRAGSSRQLPGTRSAGPPQARAAGQERKAARTAGDRGCDLAPRL